MPVTLIGLGAALLACILVQAFAAASEIALVSADEAKVKAESEAGSAVARKIDALLEKRDHLLALALTTSNLAIVIAGVLLTTVLHAIRPSLAYWAPVILTPVALIIGEAIPKLIALGRPLAFARLASGPLTFLSTVLAPILAAETAFSRAMRRLLGVPIEEEGGRLTREDLALLLHRRGARAGAGPQPDAILPAERLMISRIFRFARTEARKAMMPLVRVVGIPEETTIKEAIETISREGYSRIPVFHQRITDIVGVIHVFDLLESPDLSRPVGEVMRPVSYFPESMAVDQILVALQRTREHLCVIVDEYGGSSGILTVEDLLEEIVGEIEDEYDAKERLARIINRRTLRVAAQVSVAELNERFGLKLPEADDYASIGGLVVDKLGHIPKLGEQLKLDDVTITVVRSDARAVREVMLYLGHSLREDQTRAP